MHIDIVCLAWFGKRKKMCYEHQVQCRVEMRYCYNFQTCYAALLLLASSMAYNVLYFYVLLHCAHYIHSKRH